MTETPLESESPKASDSRQPTDDTGASHETPRQDPHDKPPEQGQSLLKFKLRIPSKVAESQVASSSTAKGKEPAASKIAESQVASSSTATGKGKKNDDPGAAKAKSLIDVISDTLPANVLYGQEVEALKTKAHQNKVNSTADL